MPTLRPTLGVALLAAFTFAGAAHAAAPTFSNYYPPTGVATDAGEPSIGYNPKSGDTFFQSNITTLKVTGFDGSGSATWTDVTEPTAVTSLDPILWTDRATGRTFSSQLLLACSKAAFTDDNGATWLPSQGCGIGTGVDHQTVGGGPFAGVVKGGTPVYPNAVYYCTQDGYEFAHCATSFDGGVTFGPARQIYQFSQCPLLLHGHLQVGPDGTAYVPTGNCDGHASMAESTDNGTTWTVDEVPDTTTQNESDPSLGIGKLGTLYLGSQGGDGLDLGNKGYSSGNARSEGRAWMSVKPAGSSTWRPKIDVGASFGIKNIQFPEVFAGDDNRAAYAFLGTTTAGDDQAPAFKGVWHLYVAYTYDGGLNWTTYDATPNDPVQRGCMWLQGGSSKCRNLLDFNDITIDNNGRVMVAYADGCTDACVTADPATYPYATASRPQQGVIARQESGLGLFAAKDSVLGNAAPVPARRASLHVHAPAATRMGDEGELRRGLAGYFAP